MPEERKRRNDDETLSKSSNQNIDYYDSSDEEDLRNTIGNIPVSWYDDLDHVGYDKDGNKILSAPKKDEMEDFLDRMENPDYWRKVFDSQTNGLVTLTEEQVEMLKAIEASRYPVIGYNPYQPFLDIYSSQTEIHPISNRPDSKKSFIPSLDEKKIVGKLVHAIKMGWLKPRRPKVEENKVYDLWAEKPSSHFTKTEKARIRMHFPAPKVALPNHIESYNPPGEYLFTEEELKKWENLDPEDRRVDFVPQKFKSLREVPAYDRFYNDRYQRCLDLYLAPRQRKMKLNVDISQLLPELPNLADMRPFPTSLSFYMAGHVGQVRSLSFEFASSEAVLSGGADGTVRVWSMSDGRCVKVLDIGKPITCVSCCPNSKLSLVAVSVESAELILINFLYGDRQLISSTKKYISQLKKLNSIDAGEAVCWTLKKSDKISISLPHAARQVVWHHKGDYFATFAIAQSPKFVYVHQLSKCKSQQPFARMKGEMTGLAFHPREPLLFVATQRHVRVYDLAKCALKKKIIAGTQWISAMKLHSFGDNLFIGGHDRTFSWIDLELSSKPWKAVRHHSGAIRAIAQHHKYPLVATVSDDSTAIVYYARVSKDSFAENEFVPVRKLRGHNVEDGLAILDAVFHPTQPWLITAGADGRVGVFT